MVCLFVLWVWCWGYVLSGCLIGYFLIAWWFDVVFVVVGCFCWRFDLEFGFSCVVYLLVGLVCWYVCLAFWVFAWYAFYVVLIVLICMISSLFLLLLLLALVVVWVGCLISCTLVCWLTCLHWLFVCVSVCLVLFWCVTFLLCWCCLISFGVFAWFVWLIVFCLLWCLVFGLVLFGIWWSWFLVWFVILGWFVGLCFIAAFGMVFVYMTLFVGF